MDPPTHPPPGGPTAPAGTVPAGRLGFWPRVLRPVGAVLLAFGMAIPLAVILLGASVSEDSVNAVFAVVGSGLILLFGVLVVRALPAHERRLARAVKRTVRGAVGFGVLVGIGIVIGSASILVAAMQLDPGLQERLEEQATEIGPEPWQMAVMVVALVVLAPLGEELIFRGLLLRGLVRRMPFWVAALVSAVMFAAAHLDAYALWPRAIALVLTGLVLAWIYRRRGYWAAVTAHATVNGVAAVALIATG
jgi:membrane protease YdiL (CAAX protease family)